MLLNNRAHVAQVVWQTATYQQQQQGRLVLWVLIMVDEVLWDAHWLKAMPL